MLLAVTLIMIFEGVNRYVFSESFFWAEEVVRFLMVWAFSLTVGVAGFRQMHIRTELTVNSFSRRLRVASWALTCLSGIGFSVILIYSAIPQVARYFTMGIVSESSLEMPMWALYLSIPIAGLGLLAYYLKSSWLVIQGKDPFVEAEDNNNANNVAF